MSNNKKVSVRVLLASLIGSSIEWFDFFYTEQSQHSFLINSISRQMTQPSVRCWHLHHLVCHFLSDPLVA